MARKKHPLSLARWKYHKHKAQAKFRNIGFNFTFEDWYQWWLTNGVDKNQHVEWTGCNRPCMCRKGDIGPYEESNVYCASNRQNASDLNSNIRNGIRPKARPKVSKLLYRWGDQLVTRLDLKERGIEYQEAYNHYRPEHYDRHRATELKKLTVKYKAQYGNERDRIRWEGADGQWFNLLKDAAHSLGIGGNTYRTQYRLGLHQKRYEGPTLTEFILANSRYPDPLLPDSN